ncbi:hypothetical protein BLOT_009144 [Blomia tropicalis]|nr:hypothetical protein BLOT_009144 [Blomia tropicalis]
MAKSTRKNTDLYDMITLDEEANSCNVVPAWMAKKDGGATPKNVPIKNGFNGTSTTGDDMLMNQLGKNGVIRRNMI